MVTYSAHEAVYRADAEGDVIPGQLWKALFWVLSGATINTHLLEVTEADGAGHVVYADAAPKTHGAVPIPCPSKPVNNLYINDMDNGYLLAYPVKGTSIQSWA